MPSPPPSHIVVATPFCLVMFVLLYHLSCQDGYTDSSADIDEDSGPWTGYENVPNDPGKCNRTLLRSEASYHISQDRFVPFRYQTKTQIPGRHPRKSPCHPGTTRKTANKHDTTIWAGWRHQCPSAERRNFEGVFLSHVLRCLRQATMVYAAPRATK